MKRPTTLDRDGNVVCAIHLDAGVMNRNEICDTCLDDEHEASLYDRQ